MKKTREKDFEAAIIYTSILKDIGLHSIYLSESTSQTLIQVISGLEDYEEIFADLNQYSVILNLFLFIEKVLVFHWKNNVVFSTYLIENQEMFERLIELTDDEEKFTILVFNEKLNIQEQDKTVILELDNTEEEKLHSLIGHIRNVKSNYNLKNLERFFTTVKKNLTQV